MIKIYYPHADNIENQTTAANIRIIVKGKCFNPVYPSAAKFPSLPGVEGARAVAPEALKGRLAGIG